MQREAHVLLNEKEKEKKRKIILQSLCTLFCAVSETAQRIINVKRK